MLSVEEPPKALQSLAQTPGRDIYVQIHSDTPDTTVIGRQYLFFVIPFGIVEANQREFLKEALRKELLLKGYRPKFISQIAPSSSGLRRFPILNVQSELFRSTAYDYFLFRRIAAEVRMSATLTTRPGRVSRHGIGEGEKILTKRYGFKPQLTFALLGALGEAVQEMLGGLGL